MRLDSADLTAATLCLVAGLYWLDYEASHLEAVAVAGGLFAIWKVARHFTP